MNFKASLHRIILRFYENRNQTFSEVKRLKLHLKSFQSGESSSWTELCSLHLFSVLKKSGKIAGQADMWCMGFSWPSGHWYLKHWQIIMLRAASMITKKSESHLNHHNSSLCKNRIDIGFSSSIWLVIHRWKISQLQWCSGKSFFFFFARCQYLNIIFQHVVGTVKDRQNQPPNNDMMMTQSSNCPGVFLLSW